jgi:hypothetical protein
MRKVAIAARKKTPASGRSIAATTAKIRNGVSADTKSWGRNWPK